jgi:hypothetical protein
MRDVVEVQQLVRCYPVVAANCHCSEATDQMEVLVQHTASAEMLHHRLPSPEVLLDMTVGKVHHQVGTAGQEEQMDFHSVVERIGLLAHHILEYRMVEQMRLESGCHEVH